VVRRRLWAAAATALGVLAFVCCSGGSAATGGAELKPVSYASPPASYPFHVDVMTLNEQGIAPMTFTDMAKLVSIAVPSGAPAGSFAQAIAAGMKTAWYQDPHRIGMVAGAMSDRPPLASLSTSSDLMRCGTGGLLNSTYSPRTGTYFGDPTSPTLIRESNAQLAQAIAHYGPVSYLWLDDALPISELWADAWSCGNTPVAHGVLGSTALTYSGGAPYTPANYIGKLAAFDQAMHAPVIDEGACVGDGTTLGGDVNDGSATASLAARSPNSAGIMCENFAEGWGNRQTLNGKAVDQYWKQDLNAGVEVISAGKMFVNFQYIGNEGATNRGTVDDADQRGYIYASYMLLFNDRRSVYMTGLWGAQLGVKAPVVVFPENLLVPLQPLTTAVWPQRIDVLRDGGAYVREFAACAYAGRAIGPCAAIVNPSSSSTVAMPHLVQTYGHAVTFTGNDGAFTGKHGTPNYGDTGDVDFTSKMPPASLPPAGWAILVR
jgi:hypothetical protein